MVDQNLEVDQFLAHYGVKGMKWGERKARPTSGSPRRGPKPETVKKLSTEIALGSIAPAAMILGVIGPPMSVALGLSIRVLQEPAVHRPIAKMSVQSAKLMKEIGDTKLTVMREARVAKKKLQKSPAIGSLVS